ncbi:DUF5753 domain-containing protein [Streptomyces sp. NPDC050287]|uniref:DUF5753 domain-containing protein n=1 Tax=Streptomyces sp. NPDC050287 TaxID=3365608 RepID=UPI0037B4E070
MHHLYLADDVGIELVELFSRNPQLKDRLPACLLDRVPAQELRLDFETGDEAGAIVLDVPVPRDLDGVVLVEALVSMARSNGRGWWERYRGALAPGLLDIAELESHAVRMRTAHTAHIPGLFQTSDHALELFRAVLPPLPEHEVALRLAFRAERQQVLEGENPPEYVGVVHEAALRMQFGGPKVARAQLEHLLTVSERPAVRLVVVPFAAGTFPGAGQTVNYLDGPVPQLDTAQVDNSHGPEFLGEQAQLAKYRAHLDWMERIALSPEDSRDFIQGIANSL